MAVLRKKIKKPELLAPAGNLEKLKVAFAHGADAVYCGLPDFSLRTRLNDFSVADIRKGAVYAHKLGKKIYVTLNIFAGENHLASLRRHALQLKNIHPDAIFIADPGVLESVKKVWPQARFSLSTQANCSNSAAVAFWSRQGVKRVILSRELSLSEIADIKKKSSKTEVEVFVHGALCSSYSGRCFLSEYFLARNANLGDCVQPCRWEYEMRPVGHEKKLIIGEDRHGSYLLNSKDLCLIEKLPEIIASGVDALKIEGRAKSSYYLANVVGAYRRGIDIACSKSSAWAIREELSFLKNELSAKLQHRGYSTGFMFKDGGDLQNREGNFPVSEWEFCGQISACRRCGKFYELTVIPHNTILAGEEIEVVGPAYENGLLSTDNLRTQEGDFIQEAHGGGGVRKLLLTSLRPWPVYSVLRRKKI